MATETNLSEMVRILWSARIDATCNRSHLTRRMLPPLTALADKTEDAHFRQAVAHTTTALTHLDAMLEGLRAAVDLLQPHAPAEGEKVPSAR